MINSTRRQGPHSNDWAPQKGLNERVSSPPHRWWWCLHHRHPVAGNISSNSTIQVIVAPSAWLNVQIVWISVFAPGAFWCCIQFVFCVCFLKYLHCNCLYQNDHNYWLSPQPPLLGWALQSLLTALLQGSRNICIFGLGVSCLFKSIIDMKNENRTRWHTQYVGSYTWMKALEVIEFVSCAIDMNQFSIFLDLFDWPLTALICIVKL